MKLHPHQAVAHDTFGIGHVTKVGIAGRITVKFDRDGSTRTILASHLRAPSKGLLPYRPIDPSDGAHINKFLHRGHVPFQVVAVGIDDCVGATVAEFVVETASGELSVLSFFFEHMDMDTLGADIRRFSKFCEVLGAQESGDTDDFVGRRACLHVAAPGASPTFQRLAA